MNNNTQRESKLYNKIKNINNSIDTMLGCVKHLEKIRSYNYLTAIDENELKEVLSRMQQLEESLEKLNNSEREGHGSTDLIKAVGKNRKLLVKKPVFNNNNNEEIQEAAKKSSNIIFNSTVSQPKNVSIDKIFDKNITSKEYHREAKQRARRVLFKNSTNLL
ncbi:MAG: hypothetical protein AB1782_19295 [Cyanobacteriota bacterium]